MWTRFCGKGPVLCWLSPGSLKIRFDFLLKAHLAVGFSFYFILIQRVIGLTRREAREQGFQVLFEQAVTDKTIEEIFHDAGEARDFVPDPFAEELSLGVEEHREEIDERISKHIRGWSISRLSRVTLALLRLAVFEMLFEPSIPRSVSINEAVELAKVYGGKDDAPYLNGVLASVDKELPKETGQASRE